MQLQKRYLLIVVAVACLILWYYGSENIPYLDWLPTIGGILFAVKNIADLAKQPQHEQLSTQSDTQSKPRHDTKHN